MLIASTMGNKDPVDSRGQPSLSMLIAAGHRHLSRTVLLLAGNVSDKRNFTFLY